MSYASLFLIAGAALLSITYVLVAHSLAGSVAVAKPIRDKSRQEIPVELITACENGAANDPRADRSTRIKCAALYASGVAAGRSSTANATKRDLLVYSALTLGAMTLLSAGIGWWLAGRALRPIGLITATAQRASEDNLGERISLDGPEDELKRLADTFDAMLGRLDGAFAAQQRFVGNASHELRTPLTLMRTAIDVTLAKPNRTPAQLEQMAVDVRGAVERAEALIEALLTLARSEGNAAAREPVDLATIAEDALEVVTARSETDVVVDTALVDAPSLGDPVLLERLVANLIANAIAYNIPGGWVRVTTGTTPTSAFLEVANTGPHVAGDDLPLLFEPFQRLDGRAGSPAGAGLGLSVVRAIATAHGARIDAHPRRGGGLEMALEMARPTDGEPAEASATNGHAA